MQVRSATWFVGLAVFAGVAQADTGWSLDSGVIHTDNATLVDTDRQQDTVASAGGAIAWQRQGRRLDTTLNGAGGWLHYLNNTYSDDFLGQADGSMVFKLLPERVTWTFQDTYGQITADPFSPATPINRQDVNVFGTGPDIHLRLGSQMQLQMAGRYGDTRYQDSSQIDTRNWGGSIGLVREASPAVTYGIHASQNRYDYKTTGVPLFDQQAAWLALQATGARQELSVEVGANRIHSTAESQTRPLARVTWQRRVRPSWTMNLQLSSEYQNASQQFVAGNTTTIGISSQPAAVRRADLTFAFERPRTTFSFGGGVGKTEYIGTTGLDEKTWSAHTNLSRRFTPRLQGFLGYRVDLRRYVSGPPQSIRLGVATAGLDWQIARSVFATLGYARTDSGGVTALNRYATNVASLRLSWRGGSTAIGPRTFGF